MVKKFYRPKDVAEAVSMLAACPEAQPLAGGTWLLTSQFRSTPLTVVSIDGLLDSGLRRSGESASGYTLEIGAGASFQSLIDSPAAPEVLRGIARCMADRNIRNRATVAGNIGANKSCSSLLPFFLVAGAEYDCADGDPVAAGGSAGVKAYTVPAASWKKQGPEHLITGIRLRIDLDRLYAYRRWARTACDVSVITAAVAYTLEGASGKSGGIVRGIAIACGGLGPVARRFPELEVLFEGKTLPDRDAIEAAIAPRLDPISDVRASAGFKRCRAASLIAEAMLGAAQETTEVRS